MLTQDNRTKLVQLVREDTGENANFFMLQIIDQVGLQELESARRVTSLLDGVLQQIEMLNNVLETGEEFRRQVYNPNDGENEEIAGMADDEGFVSINTQNAPMLLEQSLWSLVTLVAFAKMKDLNATSPAMNINEVDSSADVTAQKYTPDVLQAMGLEPRQEEPQARQEEPEPEEEPAEEPEDNEIEDMMAELRDREETDKIRMPLTGSVFKSLSSRYKKDGLKSALERLESLYNLDVLKNKTESDSRKIPNAANIFSFTSGRAELTKQLNISTVQYEDLKAMTLVVKILLESIKMVENTGLAEVSIFPEFYFDTTGTDTVIVFNQAQTYLNAIIFTAHAMNKSNQLVNEMRLRVSNQEINMIYNSTLDLLADEVDKISFGTTDMEQQNVYVDRIADELPFLKEEPKIRNDLSRRMEARIKIKKFTNKEKIIKPEESTNITNVTMRGF